MNLLFDIDGTITQEDEFVIKNAPNYLRKQFGFIFSVANPNGYGVSEVFGIKEYLENGGINKDDIREELERINSGFWNRYFVKYLFYPLKKDTSKSINAIRKEGHKIYFASLRGHKTHETENFFQKYIRTKIVPLLTRIQLKLNHIKYDGLFIVESNEEKTLIAKKLNVIIAFDDQIEVLRMLDQSIIPVCVEAPHNSHSIDSEGFQRILFDYQNIKSIISNPACRGI